MKPLPAFRSGVGRSALLITTLGVVTPSPGGGQELPELVAACAGTSETLTALCHQAALALEAARGGLTTAASAGSEIPGAASTLGYRLRSHPRFAVSARGGLARFSLADLQYGYGSDTRTETEAVFAPSLNLGGTVGALDGFSLAPTVGGILSLDITGSVHKLFPPEGHGIRGSGWGWGVGARVGILRESFTLPGVSISATRRWLGSFRVGDGLEVGPAEAKFDLEATSLRGVVGKDILGVGLLAGLGWDRVQGGGTIRARTSLTGPEGFASSSSLTSSRLVYFAGGSLTFLVAQVSAEAGWSQARDPELPEEPGGSKYPPSGAYFAALSVRVTF